MPFISTNIQYWACVNALTMLACSLLHCALMNLSLILKANTKATVDTGIAKISLAINCSVGYLRANFH